MTSVLIGCLLAVILVVAKLWRDIKSENEQLRSQIASLKRQLARNSRG
jgi:hypothetical protein